MGGDGREVAKSLLAKLENLPLAYSRFREISSRLLLLEWRVPPLALELRCEPVRSSRIKRLGRRNAKRKNEPLLPSTLHARRSYLACTTLTTLQSHFVIFESVQHAAFDSSTSSLTSTQNSQSPLRRQRSLRWCGLYLQDEAATTASERLQDLARTQQASQILFRNFALSVVLKLGEGVSTRFRTE